MKYEISNSANADTRSAKSKLRKDLHLDTLKHIKDVQSVMSLVAIELQKKGIKHDYTKIYYLEEFYRDWKEGSEDFVEKRWYQKHIKEERHHSNSYMHSDFNLLDLIEEIVDKICAGKGRSGEINMDYFKYNNDILQTALKNTVEYIDGITSTNI